MSPMVKAPLTLEHALLGFLRPGPMHAYEMHRQLQRSGALPLVWRIKQSQLYALLTRLEDAGYIAVATVEQSNRPPRKMLHLTEEGARAFLEWIAAPVRHGRDIRQEFLAKLYFAHREGPETAQRLIERQRAECRALIAELQTKAEQSRRQTDRPNGPFPYLVYEFRISQLQASLAWLDTCAEILIPADVR